MVKLFSVPRCGRLWLLADAFPSPYKPWWNCFPSRGAAGFGSLRMHSLHPPCAFFLPFSPLPAFSPWLPYVLQHTSFLARAYNIYKEYGHSSFHFPPLLFLALNYLYIMCFCIIHWFFRQKNSLIACRSGIKPYLCTRFRKGTPLNARRSGSLLEKSPAKIWRFEKSALSLQTVSLFCGSREKKRCYYRLSILMVPGGR